MKFLIALCLTLTATIAHANIQGFSNGSNIGLYTGINCPSAGGMTCAKGVKGQMNISMATTPVSATARTRFTTYWAPMTPSSGTLVTPSATTMYLTQMEVTKATTLNGIQVVNGTTVGTNKYIVALYSSEGVLLANSALAGVTTSGASSLQMIPFVTPYTVPGARTIWVAVMLNGNTDNFYALPAMAALSGLAGSITGQTFGTVPSTITVPTTFTAGVGPISGVYGY